MKRFLTSLLLLSLCLVAAESSAAELPTFGGRHAMKILGGSDTVPPEWAGIWTTVDSIYSCAGVFQSTQTNTDTLCAGQSYDVDSTGVTCPFSCTSTANATSVTQHCTGNCEVFEECTATFTSDFVGTRTADSYFTVGTFSFSYAGTGKGCDFLPDMCTQINSHGTRVGPAPEPYCSTPVESATWGRIKSRYR